MLRLQLVYDGGNVTHTLVQKIRTSSASYPEALETRSLVDVQLPNKQHVFVQILILRERVCCSGLYNLHNEAGALVRNILEQRNGLRIGTAANMVRNLSNLKRRYK